MINLSSWKTWTVLAGTLLVVTLLLYLVYVADTQASEKVALNQLTPKLSVEETEQRCLERLQAEVPALLSQVPLAANIPIVDHEQRKIPVLITPTQYAVLDYSAFLNQVQDYVFKTLPSCVQETGGYTLENLHIYPLLDSPTLSISLQYTLLWQKRTVKQSRTIFTSDFNAQNLFQLVQEYVQVQRVLPAVQVQLLERLSAQYRVKIELYGLGDTVIYQVFDPNMLNVSLLFAAQYPWQQPVQGAELKEAGQLQSFENVRFKEGKFWIIK